MQCFFFPNAANEKHLANIIRACKKSLDIAMFTVTNNTLSEAIKEVYKRGIQVRLVTDDVCCKMLGSDIYKLASLGIPIKTMDSVRNQMHHKFAIIDNCVLVTGSFNWTAKAVNQNQENILILEDKYMANRYTIEFDRMWEEFIYVNGHNSNRIPSSSSFDWWKAMLFIILCIYLVPKFVIK
jgi:phosphatidylserine/phosphatidylglycerophosphate/cardiolipin synthase-like enzyme